MVTQETNEGGSKMNKNNGQRNSYTRSFRNENKREKGDGRRFEKGDRPERSEKGERPDRGDRPPRADRPDRGSYQRQDNAQGGKPRYNKNEGGRTAKPDHYDKNKGYSQPRFSGKDEDDEDNSRRSKPSRPKESKPSVSIPDKNKVQLRLEKEQKSMKKKQSKKKESSRPQPKVKRANNVNYTRNYANGDYDDYDDYYDDF